MKRLAFFHFNPIELFPPAQNLIEYFCKHTGDDWSINVYTTFAEPGIEKFSASFGGKVRIVRLGRNDPDRHLLVRYFNYVFYYFCSFFHCLFSRPSILFYIETMSAPVPVCLKNFVFRRIPLFVHYHEYMSIEDYNGWPLANMIHSWEKSAYRKAVWISQTNMDRARMFVNDLGIIGQNIPLKIMPNYPQRRWAEGYTKTVWAPAERIRLVYIGAVDLKNICFAEIIDWIERQRGRYELDVFSNQDPALVEGYARQVNARFVRFLGSVPYMELPALLVKYDVGLILYRGGSKNFMYNAPNKLFEYLAVGLDVWYPSHLEGIKPYTRLEKHPMVIPMNIADMETFNVDDVYQLSGIQFELLGYFAEDVYHELLSAMVSHK